MSDGTPVASFPDLRRRIWWAWLVPLITVVVYLPALGNGFVWDDWRMIVHNPHFGPDWTAGATYYARHLFFNLYQPLTCAVWALLAGAAWTPTAVPEAGHLNPALFHAVGLLLHAGAAGVLFDWLRQVTADRRAALLGALVFALHPVQVEAVAFAGAMNNPLEGLLAFAALDCYWRAATRQGGGGTWWLGAMLFLLAVLAKPAAVVLPLIAGSLDALLLRRGLKAIGLALWPWCVIALLGAGLTMSVQRGVTAPHSPLWSRPLLAGDAIALQTAHALWPMHLGIDYGHSPEHVLASPTLWVGWLPAALLIALATLIHRRLPLVAAGVLMFLVAMLPNAGLVPFDFQVFSTVADRYVYLSMAGVALLIAAAVVRVPGIPTTGLVVLLLVLLTSQTERQIATWHDDRSLYLHALDVNPRSWMSAANLSDIEPDPVLAVRWARRAIEIRPATASAWNNLGSLLMQAHRPAEALDAFHTAATLDSANPTFADNYQRALQSQRPPR